jgi:hypothetical protein
LKKFAEQLTSVKANGKQKAAALFHQVNIWKGPYEYCDILK